MITHVVVFKPRADLTPADREGLIIAFERAVRDIPHIRGVRVGRRVKFGAGYEQTSPDIADVLILIDFDDLAGLRAYLEHSAHAELGARFNQAFGSGVIADFEIAGGLELLRTAGD